MCGPVWPRRSDPQPAAGAKPRPQHRHTVGSWSPRSGPLSHQERLSLRPRTPIPPGTGNTVGDRPAGPGKPPEPIWRIQRAGAALAHGSAGIPTGIDDPNGPLRNWRIAPAFPRRSPFLGIVYRRSTTLQAPWPAPNPAPANPRPALTRLQNPSERPGAGSPRKQGHRPLRTPGNPRWATRTAPVGFAASKNGGPKAPSSRPGAPAGVERRPPGQEVRAAGRAGGRRCGRPTGLTLRRSQATVLHCNMRSGVTPWCPMYGRRPRLVVVLALLLTASRAAWALHRHECRAGHDPACCFVCQQVVHAWLLIDAPACELPAAGVDPDRPRIRHEVAASPIRPAPAVSPRAPPRPARGPSVF